MTPSDRMLALLCCLANQGGAMTVKALAAQTQQPTSTAYRHLRQLLAWGMVSEREGGTYAPGPQAVRLQQGFERSNDLLKWARPVLMELTDLTEEGSALLVPVRDHALCVDMIDSSQPLRCCYHRGQVQPLLKGASARALLAFMSDEERAMALALRTPKEQSDALTGLEQIRAQGVATSLGEIDGGIWGASAPVFSARGKLKAVVSLMAPEARVRHKTAWLADQARNSALRLGELLE
ncbi:IclR family transcriptional regulator [Halomonas cupida]|uniref:IclR family transcriptional regulator n=1 Tax=Halomonas TaxID=2745 RepID=UPI001A8F863A|nr:MULTISPECIES: IclR family transcriptional regulator [Halomonas]MBN8414425.1 IclR family transcriptional regulator [Halomonas litopenaei]MBY5984333.1 IclR family transcriptional regulator [Halomonas sp. DP5Y7-2]